MVDSSAELELKLLLLRESRVERWKGAEEERYSMSGMRFGEKGGGERAKTRPSSLKERKVSS